MKYLLSLFFVAINLFAGIRTIDITPSDNNGSMQSIRILDQKELNYSVIDGLKFSEISDLAYWDKAQKLFMISDEGKLFVFHAKFTEKIEDLKAIEAANLTKKGGKRFKKWAKDSEGMTIDAKGRLLISFEGKAKIGWFHKNSDKIGQRIKKYTIPTLLQNPKNYRSRNKSLEALAWHPEYGILTVAEWPLKQDDKKQQTIYALNGKKWHFKAEPEEKSAVTAIEVMQSGDLLVLERSYTGLTNPFVVTLKRVYLKNCKKGICRTEVLAKMNTHKGWSIDNFEGLTRVGKNRYVMVSDDNDNFFQRTLLIYFEVKE